MDRLFHISFQNLSAQSFEAIPRIPQHSELIKLNHLEDDTIPRFCVSPLISHCLGGLGDSINEFLNKKSVFNIFEPEDYSRLEIMSNREIVKRKLVYDAFSTLETWILNKCQMKQIAQGKILSLYKTKKVTLHLRKNKQDKKIYTRVAELGIYKYEIINGDRSVYELEDFSSSNQFNEHYSDLYKGIILEGEEE